MRQLPLLMPFLKKSHHCYRNQRMHQQTHCIIFGMVTKLFMHMEHDFLEHDFQLFSQLAVMARLSNFVHCIWSMITVKQSRRNLIDNIKHIKSQIEMIESETFSIDEIVENLSRNEEVDRVAHQKFVAEFSNNLEVQAKTREVFLHFTTKIVDLMEPYLETEDSNGVDTEGDHLDMVIDPTNLAIERSFGLLKFFEERFIRLSFGCLSALTIAKFNNLPQWLPTFDDEKLLKAHDSERTNQSLSRDDSTKSNASQHRTKYNQVIIVDFEILIFFPFDSIISAINCRRKT